MKGDAGVVDNLQKGGALGECHNEGGRGADKGAGARSAAHVKRAGMK